MLNFTTTELALFTVLALVISAVCYYVLHPKNLPPGPVGLPFVGSLFYIRPSSAHMTLSEWAKDYGPLMSFFIGNRLVLALGNADVIREALVKQGDIFSGRTMQNAKDGIVSSEGPLWKEHRRFALSTLRDFGFGRPLMEQKIHLEVGYLLDDIESRKGAPFDSQYLLNNAVSNVICSLVFGKRFQYDDKEFKELIDIINLVVARAGSNVFSPGRYFPKLMMLASLIVKDVRGRFQTVWDFLNRNLKEHRENFNVADEPDDYISAFFKAQAENVGQYFTDKQLLWSIMDLFVAGTETTATTLRWCVLYMGHYPEVQQKVFEEIASLCGTGNLPSLADRTKLPYTEAVIMEIQRIATLVPLSVAHKTLQETKLMGYDIPRNTIVVPLLWAVHNDPQEFPNPTKFDPTRFLDEDGKIVKREGLMPFSIGKRACLGESLARMELFLFFTAMISTFRFSFSGIRLPDIDDTYVGGVVSPKPFDVIAEKRW